MPASCVGPTQHENGESDWIKDWINLCPQQMKVASQFPKDQDAKKHMKFTFQVTHSSPDVLIYSNECVCFKQRIQLL